MTNSERAEQIVNNFDWIHPSQANLISDIKQALEAAVEEGQNEIRQACSQHQHEQYSDGFKKGFASAIEAAERALIGYHDLEKEKESYDAVIGYDKLWKKSKGELC